MFPIELLGVKSYPAKSARNLGVVFDKNFNFHSHISAICTACICSSCIYRIWDLRHIRRHLDLDCAKLLANALVSNHLDYRNSLLSEIAKLTSTSSNVFWTVWLMWSQSHHHLLAVFHCCAPFIGVMIVSVAFGSNQSPLFYSMFSVRASRLVSHFVNPL